jgi:hypothetical protein
MEMDNVDLKKREKKNRGRLGKTAGEESQRQWRKGMMQINKHTSRRILLPL